MYRGFVFCLGLEPIKGPVRKSWDTKHVSPRENPDDPSSSYERPISESDDEIQCCIAGRGCVAMTPTLVSLTCQLPINTGRPERAASNDLRIRALADARSLGPIDRLCADAR